MPGISASCAPSRAGVLARSPTRRAVRLPDKYNDDMNYCARLPESQQRASVGGKRWKRMCFFACASVPQVSRPETAQRRLTSREGAAKSSDGAHILGVVGTHTRRLKSTASRRDPSRRGRFGHGGQRRGVQDRYRIPRLPEPAPFWSGGPSAATRGKVQKRACVLICRDLARSVCNTNARWITWHQGDENWLSGRNAPPVPCEDRSAKLSRDPVSCTGGQGALMRTSRDDLIKPQPRLPICANARLNTPIRGSPKTIDWFTSARRKLAG
jgi:hypothetical protein